MNNSHDHLLCSQRNDTGMFGKADPYARLIIGVQEFSTRPNPAGGKNPIWNEEFVFDISNERYARHIVCAAR